MTFDMYLQYTMHLFTGYCPNVPGLLQSRRPGLMFFGGMYVRTCGCTGLQSIVYLKS